MGKRGRRRGTTERGRGAARTGKERRLGIIGTGMSKTMLDAMHEASIELHHVGIGVCVQEEQRERQIAESLWTERESIPGWHVGERARLASAAEGHAKTADLWARRIKQAAEHVAATASDADVARAAAAR